MRASKTEHFTEKQNKMVKIAKALEHPAIIANLEQLLKGNTGICGDVVSECLLAQPAVF